LKRITIIENDIDTASGEAFVTEKDRCEALNEMMSGQGLELVHIEVEEYKDIMFD
jgi:hypothetical protein